MGTLTSGDVTIPGVTVLDSSSLTSSNGIVVHPLIGGGLPKVTTRASRGLSGTLELLCPDAQTADAVYAAHLGAAAVHLDDWQRKNLATYWRDPAGVDPGQPGTASVVETGGPVGMGWWQFVSSGPDSGSPFLTDYSAGGTGAVPVMAGETYTVSAYVRQDSADEGTPSMRIGGNFYDAAGTLVSSTPSDTLSTVEGAFDRISRVITVPTGIAFFKPVVSFSGSDVRPAGTVYYVVGVMLEPGDQPGTYFNGSTSDTSSTVYQWSGEPDGSASMQYSRPALNVWYVADSAEIPHRRGHHWLVRVAGVQEVAAP